MISVNPISSAGQASTYFQRDDYYHRKSESPSEWHGEGAVALGLSGSVGKEEFKEILEGRLPTGDTLGRVNADGEREHKCGYDLTISAPKSFSVAALVGGDSRLLEAHDQAVKTSLYWLEKHAAVTRVKQGGKIRQEHTGNLMIGVFKHETSRARDPQVHSHAVIANATRRGDGAWRSIEGREILRLQKDLDRVYQNELAVRTRGLGYEVDLDREKGRVELAAIPLEVRQEFSRRSTAIEAALGEKGKTRETASAAEREQACLATRDRKTEVDRDALRQKWISRARELGFDPERVVTEARVRAAELVQHPAPELQTKVDQAVKSAVEHLSERSAAFRAADLDQVLTSKFFGDYNRAELDQSIARLRERGELISKEVGGLWDSRRVQAGYTTPQGQKLERQMMVAAKRGRGAFEQGITSLEKAREAILEAEGNRKWNEHQKQAAEGILTSRDRFVAVQGVAGSAKTSTVLRSVAGAAKEEGFKVRGLAPSAAAAWALEEGAGIKSQTLHSFLGELRQAHIQEVKEGRGQEPTGKSLWIVDETGMVSSQQMRDLLRAAETQDARVVMAGDVRQLGSVEAGRAFAQVQEHVQTFRVETILRQRDSQLKQDVQNAYRGRAVQALDKIQARGGVIEIANPRGDREAGLERRSQAIAGSYLALSPEDRERTLVIAPGRDDRAVINQTIGAGLIAEGTVKENGFKYTTLERKGLTRVEIKNSWSYQAGEMVRFQRSYEKQGIGKGTYWEVAGVIGKTVLLDRDGQQVQWNPARHSRVEVYRSVSRELGEGDWIIFNKNDKEAGLVNGQTAVVRHLDGNTGQARVISRDGEIREVNLRENPHWNYGYGVTTYAAQGGTADRVLIHAESHRANLTTQRSLYVGISRARDEVRVFTDDAAKLKEAVSLRTGEKEMALDEKEIGRMDKGEQEFQGPARELEIELGR